MQVIIITTTAAPATVKIKSKKKNKIKQMVYLHVLATAVIYDDPCEATKLNNIIYLKSLSGAFEWR